MEITELKLGDEGKYEVIVKNKLGEAEQSAVVGVSR